MSLRVMLAAICCQKGDLPGNLAAHDRVLRDALTVHLPLRTHPAGAA